MNNWIPKNRIVKFAVAAAAVGALIYSAGLFVVLRNIGKMEDFYAGAESELSREERAMAVKKIVEANPRLIQVLRDFFIQRGDEVRFIERIEEVAEASGLTYEIDAIDVKASEDSSFKEDVNVKMKIEGSWAQALGFLDRLKKMPFGVMIERTELDLAAAGRWSGSVEFVIFREK